MEKRIDGLTEFLAQTQAIYEQAQLIDSDMDKNELAPLERLQELFDSRQETIEALAAQGTSEWAVDEQAIIAKIQQTEIQLQPLMQTVHEQFAAQMARLGQARKVSGQYAGAYRQPTSGGSFIDQRK
ncbi:flagellar protein FliT [Planococcus maritimus]|nr:flagellar protein FliT [Planococcus sp. SK3692]MDE4085017.1 flagellar protein FliT [Planococcus maritimus]